MIIFIWVMALHFGISLIGMMYAISVDKNKNDLLSRAFIVLILFIWPVILLTQHYSK